MNNWRVDGVESPVIPPRPETRFRYVEVCAGAGGLGLGLHRAGWTGTGMEIDPDAAETHNANVGPCLVADIAIASAPHAADLVGGGVPCQSFSAAGNGDALEDPRGQLFASLLRIGVQADARCILLENVRGLKSSGALPVILAAFRAAGYEPVHALLCAADYGVPQNRVRLFIAGFRDADDLARFRWPSPSHGAPDNLYGLPRWRTVRDALNLHPTAEYEHGRLSHATGKSYQGMRTIAVDRPAPTVGGSTRDLLGRPILAEDTDPILTEKYRRKRDAAMRGRAGSTVSDGDGDRMEECSCTWIARRRDRRSAGGRPTDSSIGGVRWH